jgi:hypothetical protein
MAHALDLRVLGPAGGRGTLRRRQRLLELTESLRRIDEPVDLLLARFAWRYLAEQRRPLDPVFRPPPEDTLESGHVNPQP